MTGRPIHAVFSVCAAFMITVSPGGHVRADDHVVLERTRTYMGTTSPSSLTDIWLNDRAVAVRKGDKLTVYRFDVGKIWTIAIGKNRYTEDSLASPGDNLASDNGPDAPHEAGFSYTPYYEWTIVRTDTMATVGRYSCRKLVAHGEADYSDATIDMRVTGGVTINLKRFFRRYLTFTSDPAWRTLYRSDTAFFQTHFVMKSALTEEPAIATTIVTETLVKSVEIGEPPPGVYELPKGCARVTTLDE